MRVTIGIPFYNAEPYLELAIQSVLNQTFKDYELILSDDGSTDNSLKIAKSFNDPRIIVLSDGKNKGISYRLNELISLANGEYFARMDGDDIMFADRIKKQLDFLETNSDIDVVGSQAIIIDESNKIKGIRTSSVTDTFIRCFISNPFIHPTVMGHTEWFRKYPYDGKLNGAEDADLWIRAFNKSRFSNINEPLLFYRDSNKINIKTYKHRSFQLIKLLEKNQYLLNNRANYYRYRLLISIKLIIFNIIIFLHIDNLATNRRNKKLTANQTSKFQTMIAKITLNEISEKEV